MLNLAVANQQRNDFTAQLSPSTNSRGPYPAKVIDGRKYFLRPYSKGETLRATTKAPRKIAANLY